MITGRKADTIVTGGENVAPMEVEDVLLLHPDVADAGVFGRPDAEWGEAVVASVVLRDGAGVEPDELRAFCARGSRAQGAQGVRVLPGLPRSPTGKLLRRELGWWAARSRAAASWLSGKVPPRRLRGIAARSAAAAAGHLDEVDIALERFWGKP